MFVQGIKKPRLLLQNFVVPFTFLNVFFFLNNPPSLAPCFFSAEIRLAEAQDFVQPFKRRMLLPVAKGAQMVPDNHIDNKSDAQSLKM